MAKILKMSKRTSPSVAVEHVVLANSQGDHQHVVKYPRVQRGSHFADFMQDKRLQPEVYHCLIQREDSKAILSWTQHSTLEAAMQHAEVALTLILGSSVAEA